MEEFGQVRHQEYVFDSLHEKHTFRWPLWNPVFPGVFWTAILRGKRHSGVVSAAPASRFIPFNIKLF